MKDRYTCSECGLVFDSEWSDAEARAEAEETFGTPSDGMAVVCDACWMAFRGDTTKAGPEAGQ